MLPLAEQGNAIAQTEIAILYGGGHGVPRDNKKAVMWYRRAAESGNTTAQVNLAQKFQLGHGVERDYRAALGWYRKAAQAGSEGGMLGIAGIYEQGLGVKTDLSTAVHWLKAAAAKDNPLAEYQVGVHFWQGRGVERDSDEAYKWFLKAANQNYTPAMASLGMMYFGDGLPFDPVHGCAWLTLAKHARFDAKEETDRLNLELRRHCDGLPAETQQAVENFVSHWKPREIWLDRKRSEFQALLKEAARKDARRKTPAKR